jgi:hypothetical protein
VGYSVAATPLLSNIIGAACGGRLREKTWVTTAFLLGATITKGRRGGAGNGLRVGLRDAMGLGRHLRQAALAPRTVGCDGGV